MTQRNWHDAWWRLVSQPRPRSWREGVALNLLELGSWGYRALVALRNGCYDRGFCRPVRLPVPVVSVGNLTVGGTGKTSCVELLARKLSHNKRLAFCRTNHSIYNLRLI